MNGKVRLMVGLGLILALLLMVGQIVMADTNPSDVPASHPAYKAVKTLIDRGYLQLYQDGTFQGDKPVDRYTLASIVARILNEIAAGQIGTTKEDVVLLRNLTNEFRNELVELSSKGGLFTKRIDDLYRQDQVIKEDLTKTTAIAQNLSDEQTELQKEVQQMIIDINMLQTKVAALEATNAQLKADLDKTRADLEKTQAGLDQARSETAILSTKQRQQQTYIWAAIIIAIAGAVIK